MKKGFTLIELIISIALYSIILVMISSTFFAVAKLGDMISNNSNSKSEIYLLEKNNKKRIIQWISNNYGMKMIYLILMAIPILLMNINS